MGAACAQQPGRLSQRPMAVTGRAVSGPVFSALSVRGSPQPVPGAGCSPPHRAVPWGLVSLQKDGLIYGAVLEAGPGFILASEFLL